MPPKRDRYNHPTLQSKCAAAVSYLRAIGWVSGAHGESGMGLVQCTSNSIRIWCRWDVHGSNTWDDESHTAGPHHACDACVGQQQWSECVCFIFIFVFCIFSLISWNRAVTGREAARDALSLHNTTMSPREARRAMNRLRMDTIGTTVPILSTIG